jgi:hypothetical protein
VKDTVCSYVIKLKGGIVFQDLIDGEEILLGSPLCESLRELFQRDTLLKGEGTAACAREG